MRSTTPLLIALLLVLGGCRQAAERDLDGDYSNQHTVQELCDFPKDFFLGLYGLIEMDVVPGASKSISEQIGASASCRYTDPVLGTSNFGYVLISPETEYSTVVPEGARDAVATVDGVSVTEIELPLSENQDPSVAKRTNMLRATIDGWQGELSFNGGNAETRKTAASLLVRMVQTLKGAPIQSAS